MCENLETLEKMRKIQTCFLYCRVPKPRVWKISQKLFWRNRRKF